MMLAYTACVHANTHTPESYKTGKAQWDINRNQSAEINLISTTSPLFPI